MKIEIRDVTKRFGDFTALERVNLDVKSGELVALLGPSGSGKTTLLRIIAGLEWPDDGQVMFDGSDALSRSVRERHVGFVFQHYALFRHMSVFENIAFGLRVRPRPARMSEEKIREKVHELLDLVQLKWLAGSLSIAIVGRTAPAHRAGARAGDRAARAAARRAVRGARCQGAQGVAPLAAQLCTRTFTSRRYS